MMYSLQSLIVSLRSMSGALLFLVLFSLPFAALAYYSPEKFGANANMVVLLPIGMALLASVLLLVRMACLFWANRIQDDYFDGSKWLTPAGEVGSFFETDLFGSAMTLQFEDGTLMSYPVEILRGYEHDKSARYFSAYYAERSLLTRLIDGFPSVMVSFPVLAFIAILIALRDVIGVTEATLFLGIMSCVALLLWALGYLSTEWGTDESGTFTELASLCRWKTEDGSEGLVRWAEVRNGSEKITLKLDNGKVRGFRRSDLTIVAANA